MARNRPCGETSREDVGYVRIVVWRVCALFVLVGTAAAVTGDASARHAETTNPFTTRESFASLIHFVPLDERARHLLAETVPVVQRWIPSRYPTEITQIPTSKPTWMNEKRGQMNAPVVMSDLLARFRVAQGRADGFLILVTSASMYDPRMPVYRFVFGARPAPEGKPKMNIIATAQMRVFHPEREKARLTKMMLRYVGVRVCRVPHNDNPKSVMYRTILSDGDLDRMVARLPRRCRA
jgi:hypothetical protein